VFIEFILLVDKIKCWLNTPLQVLTNAPALRSLIIRKREDAADILEFLFHNHVDLRKLSLKYYYLGEDVTGLFANITVSYPDLEGLTLEGLTLLTSTVYCLVQRLKKLSDVNLSECEVYYFYFKPLETHVCICEHL